MTIWRAIFVTVSFVVILEIFQIIPILLIEVFDLTAEKHLVPIEIISTSLNLLSFYIYYRLFIKSPLIETNKIRTVHFSSVFLIFFIVVGIILFNKIFINGYNYIFNHNFTVIKSTQKISEFNSSAYFYLFSSIIAAPIIEEIVFRKFIFMQLLQKNSLLKAILVSSFCFSIIHFQDLSNLLPTFVWGIFLSVIFYQSKNIIYPIVTHFLNNVIVSIFAFYNNTIPTYFQEIKFSLLYWLITLSGLAIVIISMKVFINKTKKAET
ncbi:CPBP family intramembrane glutamic endopeptidase [Kaistella faecalis]|uniref:CPBP family intramembrane glutamic endopeptidase n=1 Tax=Kaistella faecalis TaxID=2852098 RepID=UPI001C464BCF